MNSDARTEWHRDRGHGARSPGKILVRSRPRLGRRLRGGNQDGSEWLQNAGAKVLWNWLRIKRDSMNRTRSMRSPIEEWTAENATEVVGRDATQSDQVFARSQRAR